MRRCSSELPSSGKGISMQLNKEGAPVTFGTGSRTGEESDEEQEEEDEEEEEEEQEEEAEEKEGEEDVQQEYEEYLRGRVARRR